MATVSKTKELKKRYGVCQEREWSRQFWKPCSRASGSPSQRAFQLSLSPDAPDERPDITRGQAHSVTQCRLDAASGRRSGPRAQKQHTSSAVALRQPTLTYY